MRASHRPDSRSVVLVLAASVFALHGLPAGRSGSIVRPRISPHTDGSRTSRRRLRAARTAILICQAPGRGEGSSFACPPRRSPRSRRL